MYKLRLMNIEAHIWNFLNIYSWHERSQQTMPMDITQMNYLINIVECGCNLSLAAKKIHISQSALSQFVTNFENDEEVLLFNRRNGRLDGLTESGERIFRYAQDIVTKADEMQEVILRESSKQKGTIRIGLPSLILRVYFSNFFPTFQIEHPDISLEVTEAGSQDLRALLLNDDIDYAIVIEPTNLDFKTYEQHVIQVDEMAAFMDINHPLAKKNELEWSDLNGYQLATFSKTFTTYQLISEKIEKTTENARIVYTSDSWDYLIESTNGNEVVTILPRPVDQYTDKNKFKVIPFRDYLPFNFTLVRAHNRKYGAMETEVYELILSYFYEPVN